jgi:hypothetical protein
MPRLVDRTRSSSALRMPQHVIGDASEKSSPNLAGCASHGRGTGHGDSNAVEQVPTYSIAFSAEPGGRHDATQSAFARS